MRIADNKDLLDLKIDIKCTNDIAYMDVALLVDKPEFLRLLPEYRKKHGINSLMSESEFMKWTIKLLDEDIQTLEDTKDFEWRSTNRPFWKFEEDSVELCKRFKKPGYFTQIIQFALACGVVGDFSYQHTKIEVEPTDPPKPPEYTDLPEVKIVITPMTTLKDVQEVFEKNVPDIFESHMKLLNYYYRMKNRKAGNFRRDREWYWMNIEGIGYTDIALSATSPANRLEYEKNRNRYAIPEYEMVKQAVRRYKNLLK